MSFGVDVTLYISSINKMMKRKIDYSFLTFLFDWLVIAWLVGDWVWKSHYAAQVGFELYPPVCLSLVLEL